MKIYLVLSAVFFFQAISFASDLSGLSGITTCNYKNGDGNVALKYVQGMTDENDFIAIKSIKEGGEEIFNNSRNENGANIVLRSGDFRVAEVRSGSCISTKKSKFKASILLDVDDYGVNTNPEVICEFIDDNEDCEKYASRN